ncbi:MAG: glycoside hydrolase family 1 protein [Candidatus Sericytochromatia bacterium]
MKKLVKFITIASSILFISCDNSKNMIENDVFKFPEGFLWGTSTAAYQIEGGIKNDWSTNGLDAGVSADSFNKYKEDIKKIKFLNNNAYRFSLEWSRIEPEKGKFDLNAIQYYKNILKELKTNNIKPMVTLHHFTNPVWVAKNGGWENPKTIDDFTDFVKYIVNELKDDIEIWITVNEPNVYAFKAYDAGEFPPYKKNRESALKVMGNLLKAHAQAYKAIHEIDKNSKVGFAQHIAILEPYFKLNPIDNIFVYFQNKVFNLSFWDSILTGEINISIPGINGVNEKYDILKNSMDFIGLNYYTRWYVNSSGEQLIDKKSDLTDIGWEIYPRGISKSLEMADKYAKKLNIPIYITENGIDDSSDSKRRKYIISHTFEVWKSIQKGIDIKSYMYWSLMDNFEWAEKYKPKFGLYTIDRRIRDSALIYKEISQNNGIKKDYVLP